MSCLDWKARPGQTDMKLWPTFEKKGPSLGLIVQVLHRSSLWLVGRAGRAIVLEVAMASSSMATLGFQCDLLTLKFDAKWIINLKS